MLTHQPLHRLAARLPIRLLAHPRPKRLEFVIGFVFDRQAIGRIKLLVSGDAARSASISARRRDQLISRLARARAASGRERIERAHRLVERGAEHRPGLIAATQHGQPCQRAFDL